MGFGRTTIPYEYNGQQMGVQTESDADGRIKQCKARLVAKGFSEKYEHDYNETTNPVVKVESVRTTIALAAKHGLKLHQMDVTSAFLNGELKEDTHEAT